VVHVIPFTLDDEMEVALMTSPKAQFQNNNKHVGSGINGCNRGCKNENKKERIL
jgi:hypothetical protein